MKEQEFHIDDFTLEAYRRYVSSALQNYTPFSFESEEMRNGTVFWRHDIDMSPERALELARIEKEEGMRSTYYVLPHSNFYSLFDVYTRDVVREIRSLGHDIGLHFDASFHSDGSHSIDTLVELERSMVEHNLGVELHSVSYHNPQVEHLANKSEQLGGLYSTYSQTMFDEFAYCSDSNGYWRHQRLEDFLQEQHMKIQVLTHPVWWTVKPALPSERLWSSIDAKAEATKQHYLNRLQQFGRKHV